MGELQIQHSVPQKRRPVAVSIADGARNSVMLTKDMSVASALVGADINQRKRAD